MRAVIGELILRLIAIPTEVRLRQGSGVTPAFVPTTADLPCRSKAKAGGRGSRIRTCDLQYPKLPRYQAALYPARRVVGYMFRRLPARRKQSRLALGLLRPRDVRVFPA